MSNILQILSDLAYARQQFVRRHTMAPFHRFFENEALYLSLLRDLQRTPTNNTPIRSALDQSLSDQWAGLVLNELIRNPIVLTGTGGTGRTSIWDPVYVTPSPTDIQRALVPLEQISGRICCICQEGWTDENRTTAVQLRNCSHPFHRSCIEEWFRRSCICPVCRNDIRTTGTSNTNVLPTDANAQPSSNVGTVPSVRPSSDGPDERDYVDDSRQFGQ